MTTIKPVRWRRHPHQHRRHLSLHTRRRHPRRTLGPPPSRSTSPRITSSPDEAEPDLRRARRRRARIVLSSSANAVVPKKGSEAYDVSKAALSHLVRELAVSYSPLIRVNGISPATVVKGSTMFPRDRVIASLKKYNLPCDEKDSDDALRNELAKFYAKRTLDASSPSDPKGLRAGHPLPRRSQHSLHHRPHHARRWWPDRGLPTLRCRDEEIARQATQAD